MNQSSGIRHDEHGYMSARRIGESSARPVRTYPTGRRCTCGARLSIYNEDGLCAPCSGDRWAQH